MIHPSPLIDWITQVQKCLWSTNHPKNKTKTKKNISQIMPHQSTPFQNVKNKNVRLYQLPLPVIPVASPTWCRSALAPSSAPWASSTERLPQSRPRCQPGSPPRRRGPGPSASGIWTSGKNGRLLGLQHGQIWCHLTSFKTFFWAYSPKTMRCIFRRISFRLCDWAFRMFQRILGHCSKAVNRMAPFPATCSTWGAKNGGITWHNRTYMNML